LRRIPLSHRSHVTGINALPTGVVQRESALERDFVILASFLDAEVRITSQPVTIRYEDEGTGRRYTPDFLIDWSDGGAELVEIKYRADLHAGWERLRPSFSAARAWAQNRGVRFRIATEREIRTPLLDNARRLLPLRAAPLDLALANVAMATVEGMAVPTFGALVEAMAAPRDEALAVVWRLIARKRLLTDLSSPIVTSSRLRAA
jgi:hypothetical protein